MAVWKVIVVLTCLWLMACSPQDEQAAHFKTYLTRVAYVLEVPVPELTSPPPITPLPAQRELSLMPARISSGLLDALKLGRCDMLGLVAEHNAPIGKSQSSAWQLAYHLQFQRQLELCLVSLKPNTAVAEHDDKSVDHNAKDSAKDRSEESDGELAAWLQDISALKAPQLPIYYWNMMVAEPDIRAALSPAASGLAFNAQPGFQETLAAFRLFARLKQQTQTLTGISPSLVEQLSQSLKGLYKNPYLGELFYSLHASTHYLEQSIDFLAALDDIHCQGAQAIKGQRLGNALQHYYIKDIQAYLAKLDRQFVELAPLLEVSLTPPLLTNKQDTEQLTALMADYRQQVALGLNSALYVRYRDLNLQHAKLWQNFLKRCELSPKRG